MSCVLGCDVLGKPGEEAITVLGDRAEQTRPIALSGEFNERPRTARKPRGTRLNLHGFLSLVNSYCGCVHLPPLF